MTKLHELLQGNSSVTFAQTEFNGLQGSFRFTWSKTKNDPDTYPVQIKVEKEKWASFLWVNCRITIDELIAEVEKNYSHLTLEKHIKATPKRQSNKKQKAQAPTYYIKNTNAKVGEPTTIGTNHPPFEIV